jgi:hypothetical protein
MNNLEQQRYKHVQMNPTLRMKLSKCDEHRVQVLKHSHNTNKHKVGLCT